MQSLDMETLTINYRFITRRKKDDGWDAVVLLTTTPRWTMSEPVDCMTS